MDCLAVWVLLNEEQGRVLWLNCQKRKQNITKKSPIFGPNSWLGTFDATKTDEISEKIQTAFDPLPGFSIFPKNRVFYKA